jgi:predicted ArsR family transcriptional regulator
MKAMTGETLDEIANTLGITRDAVEKRLQTAKIKPITRKALYPIGTAERLCNVRMGRPLKQPEARKKSKK